MKDSFGCLFLVLFALLMLAVIYGLVLGFWAVVT